MMLNDGGGDEYPIRRRRRGVSKLDFADFFGIRIFFFDFGERGLVFVVTLIGISQWCS